MDTLTLNSVGSSSICAISYKAKRPIFSHCNISSHTVDKCYKFHGYPPVDKSRLNVASNKASSSYQSASANQISNSSSVPPVSTLSVNQCQQIIDFLHSQPRVASPQTNGPTSSSSSLTSSSTNGPSVASFSSTILTSSSDTSSPILPSSWILDTSATHHVCCSLQYTLLLSYLSLILVSHYQQVLLHLLHMLELFI